MSYESISQFYLEPDAALTISYKVNILITSVLTEEYNGVNKLPRNCDLVFQVSASSDIHVPCLEEKPHIDYKNEYYTYYLYLPFNEVKSSSNQILAFADYVLEGISTKLAEFGYSLKTIQNIRDRIRGEIQSNPNDYIDGEE